MNNLTFRFLSMTPAFFLGFATMIVQLVFFRDFFLLFHSSEIIYSLLLAFWLMFTGLGANTGPRIVKIQPALQTFIPWLYLICSLIFWYVLPWLRNALIPEGQVASPMDVMIAATIVLLPLCSISGALFVVYASKGENPAHPARTYSADVFGAIVGSLAFYFSVRAGIPVSVLLPWSLLLFVMVVTSTTKSQRKWLIPIAFVLTLVLFFLPLPDRSGYLPGQNMAEVKEGADGIYLVTKDNGQHNLYTSAGFVMSSDFLLPSEEFVHTAMLQHSQPESVLVAGNYSPAVWKEILKYHPKYTVFLEKDPVRTALVNRFFSTDSLPEPRIIYDDIRHYSDTTNVRFDVVLIQTGGLVSLQENRFFTQRFMQRMQSLMSHGGVLLIGWNASSEYYGGTFAEMSGIIRSTAAVVFPSTALIPMSSLFLLAGDTVRLRIGELAAEKGISCDYINPYYIDDNLIVQKINGLHKKTSSGTKISSEEDPALFLLGLKQWLSRFQPYYFFIPLLVLLLVAAASAYKEFPVGFMMQITGFSIASLMTLFMLMYVYISGSMLHNLSVFYAVSMAGLAAGSFAGTWPRLKSITGISTALNCIIGISILLALTQNVVNDLSVTGGKTVLLSSLFLISAAGGVAFSTLSQVVRKNNAERAAFVYRHDVWGSFAGGLLTPLVLIPFLGIPATAFVVAGMVTVARILAYLRRQVL